MEHGYFDSENPDYLENMKKLSGDTIYKLSMLICKEQDKKNREVLDKNIMDRINVFRQSRNFWIHECFIKGHIGFYKDKDKDGEKKLKKESSEKITKDEEEARLLNEKLFDIEQNMKNKLS